MQPPLILDLRKPDYETILYPARRTEWFLVGIVTHSNFRYDAQERMNHWAAYGRENVQQS